MAHQKDNEYRAAAEAIVEFGKVVEEYEQDFADTAMMVSQLDASLRAMTRAALPTSDLTEAVRQFAESMTVRLTPLLEVQAQSITELVNDSVLFAMQEGNLAAKVREMAAGAETLSDANISYAHLAEQIKALNRMLHRIDVSSVLGESEDEATQRYVETGGIVEVRVVTTGEDELVPAEDIEVERATTRRIPLSPRSVFLLSFVLQLLPLVAALSGDPNAATLFQTAVGQVMLRTWDISVSELRRNLEDADLS